MIDNKETFANLTSLLDFVTNSEEAVLSLVSPSAAAADVVASRVLPSGATIECVSIYNRSELLGSPALARLGEAIGECPTIRSLVVNPRSYLDGTEIVGLLPGALKGSLRSFTIEGLRLGEAYEGRDDFCRLLGNSALTELVLDDTPADFDVVTAARKVHSLTSLKIAWNPTIDEVVKDVATGITQDWPKLERLVMQFVSVSANGEKFLGEALRGVSPFGFVVLDLSCNKISDEGCEAVANGLIECYRERLERGGALRELDLSSNEIGARGGLKIAELVRRTPHLESLSISCNPIGDPSGAAVGESLRGCAQSIKMLDVSVCSLGSKAIFAMCNSLRGAHFMPELYLGRSEIGPDETGFLAREILPRAETLLLNSCWNTAAHAKELAAGLRAACHGPLRRFNLGQNPA
ncbi:MAG: hypothetical protein P4L40_18720, partial [Terracidiphilus sp.]|nr:hypothetical protein [Terracidiphilus sp.]